MSAGAKHHRRKVSLALALLSLAWGVDETRAEELRFKGRSVSEVLRRLEDETLRFLYSSDLVPDSLTVGIEPRTRDRLGVAREILAEHDLGIRAVDPVLFVVERRGGSDGPEAGATPTIPRLHRVALDTVVVEASRYELTADAAAGAQRLDAVDLANQPNVADDPIRALRRLPGVVQGGLSAASNLRGGETSEVLVLLDGFPLRQPFHLPGYQSPFSLLDEALIDNIDVFTGGFPARYGNRLAGVFDIESAQAGQAPQTAIGVSFINAHVRTAGESTSGTSSWRASARQGTLRPVLQYLSVDAGRPSYGDLSLTATHRLRADLRLSGNMLWATDEYALNDDDERAEVSSRTRYSWLSAGYTPSDNFSGDLWFGHSSIEIDRVGDVDKPEFAIGNVSDHRSANLWDARAIMNWNWSDRGRLNMGFEWTGGDADYRYDSEVSFPDALAELFDREPGFGRSVRAAPTQQRLAVFASQRWRLGQRWMPEIGVRMQEIQIGGIRERTWDPRIGIRWEVSPRTGLRAHWGRFHQADEVHELAVADGVSTFSRAQRSEHLILGLEHRYTNGVQLRAEAFRKQQQHPRTRFENLLSPIEVFAEIAPDRASVAPDAAEMRGLEFSLALERESWRAWSAISVARAQDEFGADNVPRSWDQRLSWITGIDWRRGRWRAGGAATMRSGWPITPVNYTSGGDAVLGPRNSDRLPAFATLDVRVEYRRPLAVGTLAVALEISNLTNRANQCCVDVEVEDIGTPDEFIVVEDQFWPGLLPSLGIEWSW